MFTMFEQLASGSLESVLVAMCGIVSMNNFYVYLLRLIIYNVAVTCIEL